ncbi:MAG: carbohydrate kinase family protein, partial [Candidatus Diapherotrites archaeon]|nr:carbohydrate kinase family protein [Candidatus Diapherotrites archaeon]
LRPYTLMHGILCIGSATWDLFVFIHPQVMNGKLVLVPGTKMEAECVEEFSGGGATNSAVAFARLGLQTAIATGIGADAEGKKIISELRAEGVQTKFVFPAGRTATSVILTGFHHDRIILCHGHSKQLSAQLHRINWKQKHAKWIHLSSLHGDFALAKKIILQSHSNGTRIAFNPGGEELRKGFSALKPLLPCTDVLFLNREESQQLTGKEGILQNLRFLQSLTPLVVITDGPRGAWAFDGKKTYYQKTHKVKVLDATGAGDAFNSAFTAAFMKRKDIPTALQWGTQEAESVIAHLGAKNRLLKEKEMK